MRAMHAWILVAALAVGAPGCAETTLTEPDPAGDPPVVTAEAVAGSNGQAALRGTALPQTLRVRVLADGEPLEGAAVSWEPSAGTIQATSSVTDGSGVAAAVWVLGSVPGPMTVTVTVDGVEGQPVLFTATALPLVTLTADAATDLQSGIAGTLLGTPLRVRVFVEGIPAPGQAVTWTSTAAGATAVQTNSDEQGFASTTPQLPLAVGEVTYTATLGGAVGSPALFRATALPGPGAVIIMESGDNQALPANFPVFPSDLVVAVTDQYGNPTAGQPLIWTVEGGPVVLSGSGQFANATGHARTQVAPSGGPAGSAVVRVALPGGTVFAEFNLSVVPPVPLVILEPGTQSRFTSAINGSSPAVDTVLSGGQMTWLLSEEDLEDHAVAPVGELEFLPGYLGYGSSSHGFTVTLSVAGTYYYEDPYWPGMVGTIVVQ